MRLFAGLGAFLLALMAGPAVIAQPERAPPAMTATVTPLADGSFSVVMHFDEVAPLWIFRRSAVTRIDRERWRPQSWRILSEGVSLRTLGNHEALVPTGRSMPREVRLRVTPFGEDLLADYVPALTFTDGTVALFSDHFAMRPAPSVEAVEALGASFNSLPDYRGGNPRVIFRAGEQRLRHDGRRQERVVLEVPDYVVFGRTRALDNAQIWALFDPGLPDWLGRQLRAEIPAILDLYAQKLGPHGGAQPQLIVGWSGPTIGLVSLGGSVIGDTIVMDIEGQRLTRPSRDSFGYARQFIAHETAHFWLGNKVGYGDPGDAWTTEGGADLMAQRVAQAVDPDHDSSPIVARAANDCAVMAADGPLRSAPERHGQQAFYACGLIFSLVAEHHARARGGDFFSFWRGLIEANEEDGIVSVEDWLGGLRRLGAAPSTIRQIATIHASGSEDMRGAILALLASIDMPASLDAEGRIRLS